MKAIENAPPAQPFTLQEEIDSAESDIVQGQLHGFAGGWDQWEQMTDAEKLPMIIERINAARAGVRLIGHIGRITLAHNIGKKGESRWWEVDENGNREKGPGRLDPSGKMFEQEEEFRQAAKKRERSFEAWLKQPQLCSVAAQARAKSAADMHDVVHRKAAELRLRGTSECNLAGVLASDQNIALGARQIRNILKEKR